MLKSSNGHITVHELSCFYKCSRYMVFEAAPKEDIMVRSVRAALYIYLLQRIGAIILSKTDLRRIFSNIYYASLYKLYNKKRPKHFMNSIVYRASAVLDNFHDIFSLYEDSIGGDPLATNVKFRTTCDCGLHYLNGRLDAIWKHGKNLYCVIFNFTDSAFKNMDKHIPYIHAYVANKIYKNYHSMNIMVYMAKLRKIHVMRCDELSVNNVGKIICLASECKTNNLYWHQGDPFRCQLCRHNDKCNIIQGV